MGSFFAEYIETPKIDGRVIELESGKDLGPRNFDQFKKVIGQKAGIQVNRFSGINLKKGEKLTILEHDIDGGNTVLVKRHGFLTLLIRIIWICAKNSLTFFNHKFLL